MEFDGRKETGRTGKGMKLPSSYLLLLRIAFTIPYLTLPYLIPEALHLVQQEHAVSVTVGFFPAFRPEEENR